MGCTQAGCSFTNEFEVPAVVRAWRDTEFTVNKARTSRRRSLLTVAEDGTGEAIFYFTLVDDEADRLYSDTYDVAWSRDAGEFLMHLSCRDTTAPSACRPTVDMPCTLSSASDSLFCFYAPFDSVYTYEPVPEEGG